MHVSSYLCQEEVARKDKLIVEKLGRGSDQWLRAWVTKFWVSGQYTCRKKTLLARAMGKVVGHKDARSGTSSKCYHWANPTTPLGICCLLSKVPSKFYVAKMQTWKRRLWLLGDCLGNEEPDEGRYQGRSGFSARMVKLRKGLLGLEERKVTLVWTYWHTSFYCALLYWASQMLPFLQIENFTNYYKFTYFTSKKNTIRFIVILVLSQWFGTESTICLSYACTEFKMRITHLNGNKDPGDG